MRKELMSISKPATCLHLIKNERPMGKITYAKIRYFDNRKLIRIVSQLNQQQKHDREGLLNGTYTYEYDEITVRNMTVSRFEAYQ